MVISEGERFLLSCHFSAAAVIRVECYEHRMAQRRHTSTTSAAKYVVASKVIVVIRMIIKTIMAL